MAYIKLDGGYNALPISYKRGNPIPLDTTALWNSYASALSYARTSPTAYVGQILSVIENDEAQAYIIKNTAGDLRRVGTSGTSSGSGISSLSKLSLDVGDITTITDTSNASLKMSGTCDDGKIELLCLDESLDPNEDLSTPVKFLAALAANRVMLLDGFMKINTTSSSNSNYLIKITDLTCNLSNGVPAFCAQGSVVSITKDTQAISFITPAYRTFTISFGNYKIPAVIGQSAENVIGPEGDFLLTTPEGNASVNLSNFGDTVNNVLNLSADLTYTVPANANIDFMGGAYNEINLNNHKLTIIGTKSDGEVTSSIASLVIAEGRGTLVTKDIIVDGTNS